MSDTPQINQINRVEEGARFGRWTVIAPPERRSGQRLALCCCDCGEERYVNCVSLTTGRSTSCGCYRSEHNAKRFRKNAPIQGGERRGRLTALSAERINTAKLGRHPYILCRCDCGQVVEVRRDHFLSGQTRSCKCLQRESVARAQTKHGALAGGKRHPLYDHWRALMRSEVSVAPDWQDFAEFALWCSQIGLEDLRGKRLRAIFPKEPLGPDNYILDYFAAPLPAQTSETTETPTKQGRGRPRKQRPAAAAAS